MRTVDFLIAASPNDAFYSQIAALRLALRRLCWTGWEPRVHVFLGGGRQGDPIEAWRPHLDGVELHWTSDALFARDGDWAQSDDVFRHVPDADLVVALDADTFPVQPFEVMLDRVRDTQTVAGVIAHFPPVHGLEYDAEGGLRVRPGTPSNRETWSRLVDGLCAGHVSFTYTHSLLGPWVAHEYREAPFYLNFGMVAFTPEEFERIALRYLALRPLVAARLPSDDFSGQIALTLALTDAQSRTWALPLRYNFPNYPLADRLYPKERGHLAIVHYLRTVEYDRHRIFVSADEYARFVRAPLTGIDAIFRDAAAATLGRDYPFDRASPTTPA